MCEEIKLEPCPFCGGKAWAYSGTTYHFESGWGWICACKSCDAQGQIGETKSAAFILVILAIESCERKLRR